MPGITHDALTDITILVAALDDLLDQDDITVLSGSITVAAKDSTVPLMGLNLANGGTAWEAVPR